MPRILIVEDDHDLRRVIRMVLEHGDYEVVEAADGWAAVQSFDVALPDAAVIDIKMPVMNGFELIERMKSDPRTASVPVVLLTGNRDIAVNGHQLIPILLKPFEPDELLKALSTALDKDTA